jgi:hypothetical protein
VAGPELGRAGAPVRDLAGGRFPLGAVSSALCTVAAWGLVAAACRRRTASLRLIAGAVLAGYLASAPAFSARPQMFSVLLFAVELDLLEVARTRPRIALATPFLMPLWANLHGAFVVGLGLVAIEAAAAAWRRTGGRGPLARRGSARRDRAARQSVGSQGARLRGAAARQPDRHRDGDRVGIRDPAGAVLLAAIGVLVVALARSRVHARVPEQLLWMALLAGLALWAVRASVWFGLALPVAICALARERAPRAAAADRSVPLVSGDYSASSALSWPFR